MTLHFDAGDQFLGKLNQILLILKQIEGPIMTWKEWSDKLTQDFNAAAARVNTDLGNFGNQVTALQDQVAKLQQQLAGTDVPADAQATLKAVDDGLNALDVPAPINVPTPPPTPDQPQPGVQPAT